jgi:Copper binding periplasmic protein CusF
VTISSRTGAAARSTGSDSHASPSRRALARRLLVVLFVLLVVLFGAALWGTVVRPAAFEVRGEVIGRAAPDIILIRHQPVSGLGMGAMEMMAVHATPAALDTAGLAPGERVRLAVRQDGDALRLVWIERVR